MVAIRSAKEDDTSKPLLEAMRVAANQLPMDRPGFIAIQFQDLAPPDLMSASLRRRAGILSYALFGHYGASHVVAVHMSGYAIGIMRSGELVLPAFCVPNPQPIHAITPADASFFFQHLPDAEFAAAIGAQFSPIDGASEDLAE